MVLTAAIAVIAAGVPSGSSARQQTAAPSAAAVSARQRAALIGQIHDPGVANAEQQLGVVQNALIALQQDLAATNVQLLDVEGQIAQNQQILTQDQADLAVMIRAAYVESGQTGLATALLSTGNFNQAVDKYQGAQHMNDQLSGLVRQVAAAKHDLVAEQASLQSNIAGSLVLEGRLSAESNRLTAMVIARNAALVSATPQTRSLVARIDGLDNQTASTGLPGSVNAQGACGDHFALGECTYFVASQRCIPWAGNAFEWWGNARAAGYAEGHQPQAGAVIVWYPGGGGASDAGHVGIVDAVGPKAGIPAGSFKLSEMNWGGWNQVDHRVLPDNAPGISGFIYGKSSVVSPN